jgi:formate hydrogenlyase transcriptional activator
VKSSVQVRVSQDKFSDSMRALILKTLQAAGWIIGGPDGAAARLGLKRTTLISKMKKLEISRPMRQNDANRSCGDQAEQAMVATSGRTG